MNLIAKHLDRSLLTCKIHNINSICAWSGQPITEGVKYSDIIGDSFTEIEIFRHKSQWLSVDFALLTQPVIKGEKQLNALRNYSFLATENHFRLLNRDSILDLFLNIPETPFQIGVTYSNKKHIAYKTPVNFNQSRFLVSTDAGIVDFDMDKAKLLLPVIQSWYTVSKQTAQQPTWFTKDDILGLSIPNNTKINEYGIAKYFTEDVILKPYRKTLFLKLLVHILNKKVC